MCLKPQKITQWTYYRVCKQWEDIATNNSFTRACRCRARHVALTTCSVRCLDDARQSWIVAGRSPQFVQNASSIYETSPKTVWLHAICRSYESAIGLAKLHKKLGCRRETARHFIMSLKISQSHSRSFEMITLSKTCMRVYLVTCMRYWVSNNGVTLTSGLGVIQDHWKRHHSIDYI